MNALFKSVLTLAAALAWGPASAQVTLYEHDSYGGRSFTATGSLRDLTGYGFNDRASSVVVERSNWQLCEDAGFGGRCVVLPPGSVLGMFAIKPALSNPRVAGIAFKTFAPSLNVTSASRS